MSGGKNNISCQVSLYPLGEAEYREIIKKVLSSMRDVESIEVEVGAMSTLLSGPEEEIWKVLQALYRKADRYGDFTLLITLSNVCK